MTKIPHADYIVDTENVGVGYFYSSPFQTSDTPPLVTTNEIASTILQKWQVVGRDEQGWITPAIFGKVDAIGITHYGVNGSGDKCAMIAAGTFNPDMLVWDTSYDTDDKKKTAFIKSGVQIFMLAPKWSN